MDPYGPKGTARRLPLTQMSLVPGADSLVANLKSVDQDNHTATAHGTGFPEATITNTD